MSTQTKGKHGGKRAGAGRKAGSKNVLDYGAVKATKALNRRLPEDTTPEERELHEEAAGTIAAVMRGQVHFMEATPRLKASTYLVERLAGANEQKHEVTGKGGGALVVEVVTLPPEDGE